MHPNDDVNKQPVVQRRVPHGHAHGGGAGDGAASLLPLAKLRSDAAAKKRRRSTRHRQDRPHPPAGRHAADPRARSSAGYVAQLDHGERHVHAALPHLCELALGGTAVGTGLNAPKGYAERRQRRSLRG